MRRKNEGLISVPDFIQIRIHIVRQLSRMDLNALTTGKAVLVWRSQDTGASASFGKAPCPMCATSLLFDSAYHEYEDNYGLDSTSPPAIHTELFRCPLCAWTFTWEQDTHGYYNTPTTEATTSLLRALDINSADLRLAELGAHLTKHSQRLFDLSPVRFEQLITGVFSELGFSAVHTGKSGDQGADIVLFKDDRTERWGIVECKRYSELRTVKPEVLRALVGAAVDFDVRRAYLVTTGRVSRGVHAKLSDFRSHGYELELLQATEILKMLGVYNMTLPSLDKLSESVRKDIIADNTRLWKRDPA